MYTELEKNLAKKSFEVIPEPSLDSCISNVKKGKTNACIEIQSKTSKLSVIDPRAKNKIIVHADYSQSRVIGTILAQIEASILEIEDDIKATVAQSLSSEIENAISELNSKETQLNNLIQLGNEIDNQLSNTQTNINKITANINQINSNLNQTIEDLNNIENSMLFLISQMEDNLLKEQLRNIILTDLNNIKEDIIYIRSLIPQNALEQDPSSKLREAQTNIRIVTNDLRSIRNSINDINSRFEDLKGINKEEISHPLETQFTEISGLKRKADTQLRYLDYITPNLIVMVIMFTSIMFGTILVMNERKTKAYFRNIMSPTKEGIFTTGLYITTLALVLIQVIILIALSKLIFRSHLTFNILQITPILLFVSILFISLGTLIGHLFNSEETAVIAAVCLGIILMISSSTIMSIEAMPKAIGSIMKLSPLAISESLLKKNILFELSIPTLLTDLLIIIGTSILVILITASIKRKLKYKETF
jgi:ABC-type multidrug transport system permease subunit